MAEELLKRVCRRMDAFDASHEMLDAAAEKKIHRRPIQAALSKPLEITGNCCDAVVCTGTITYGHVTPGRPSMR